MALAWADGFDLYSSADDVKAGGISADSSGVAFSTTDGRFGGGCLKVTTSAKYWFIPYLIANGSTFYVAGWYRHEGDGGINDTIFRVSTKDRTPIIGFNHNASGTVTVRSGAGATLEATGTVTIPASTWVWIEMKITPGTSSSSTNFEMKIDGVVTASVTGVAGFSSTGVSMVALSGTGGSGSRWDDVVIYDTTGSSMNTYTGSLAIDTLHANGAGSVNNWSNTYAAIDETSSDDDSSYVEATTAGTKANYALQNLSVNPTTIYAVQHRVRARKPNAGTKTLRPYLRSNTSEGTGDTLAMYSSYGWRRGGLFPTNPQTSGAWTGTAVNNLRAGIEVIS